jgi:hypothetical protein
LAQPAAKPANARTMMSRDTIEFFMLVLRICRGFGGRML